ncbi:hypothetical protein HMPREF3157_08700 [Dermabacter sp. HMSC06F07]|uniref:hypothetical protein n=1 Tax=Dermabacter sp. HMSC06F07 TaxID=1581125 RepID=UPI0008A33E16|nr:hypothetical protein [Dermabacter sp. HMSC06F07]OFT45358.1 hypothetical protein HMPREF3157_08700 [Dermabacter sp. HMSC06F07]
MIETVKALPRLIKDWKTNSDLIYQLLGCFAGVLTISAHVREQRPSDVLAAAMNAIGASGVGGWFESGLPPLLAEPNVDASRTLAFLSALAVLTMLIKPFFNAKRDDWPIDLQARGLMGSRAAVTTWVFLMFAAQFASIAWVAEWVRSQAYVAVIVAVVAALLLGLAYVAARRLQMHSLLDAAGARFAHMVASAGAVVIMTGFALAFIVIGPVIGAASWLFTTESDAYSDTKRRFAQELARSQQPTGAIRLSSQSDGSDLVA